MGRLIGFLILLGFATFIVAWFIDNDGSITIEWLGFYLQTAIGFAILTAVFLVLLTAVLIHMIFFVPGASRHKRIVKKRDRGLAILTKGFSAIAAGDAKQAKKLTKQASRYLGHIPMTKLLSAQASQIGGEKEEAKKQYAHMLEDAETEIIAIKALLRQAKEDGDMEKAEFLAERALAINPDTQWAIQVLTDIYQHTKNWTAAEAMTKRAVKHRLLEEGQSKHMLAVMAIARAQEYVEAGKDDDALKAAKQAYHLAPDFAPAVVEWVKLLDRTGSRRKALSTIEKTWKKIPQPDIAEVYMGFFAMEKAEKRLNYAERLLKLNPHMQSHIAVARAALDIAQFEKARNHLKIALSIQETPVTCQLMAELEEKEHGSVEQASRWLERAKAIGTRTIGWVCQKCGHYSPKWYMNCTHCHCFDGYEWRESSAPIEKLLPIEKD